MTVSAEQAPGLLKPVKLMLLALMCWGAFVLVFLLAGRDLHLAIAPVSFLVVLLLAWKGGLKMGMLQAMIGHGLMWSLLVRVHGLPYELLPSTFGLLGAVGVAALVGHLREVRLLLVQQQAQLEQLETELSRRQEELLHSSEHDLLTGILNRRCFSEKVKHEYAWAVRCDAPFSVAVFDIDGFKAINDLYTHKIGDQVLREVAQMLAHTVRELDVVARYGGEEFAAFFPCTTTRQALIVAERFRAQVQQHNWDQLCPGLQVTVSGGVCGDAALGDPERMLVVACELLEQAKATGRNRVEYFREPNLN